MSKTAIFFLAVLLLVAGSTVLVLALRGTNNEPPLPSGSYTERILPAEPLEEFQLTAQTGQEFDSSSLRGKVWVASFFYASCPATCRRQNEAIADLQRRYGERGVKFLSISVDPASDDPLTLRTYAQSFNADPEKWFFLTDRAKNMDYISRIGGDIFKTPVTTQGHYDVLILVDRNGVIPDDGYYNWKKPEEIGKLYQAIESLLAEPPQAAEAAADESSGEPEPSAEERQPVADAEGSAAT